MAWGLPAHLQIEPHPGAPWPEKPQPGPHVCQLAEHYRASRFPASGAIVDKKIDGIRALWFGNGPPQSREGADLEVGWWVGGALGILAERLGPGDWFIDGELTVGDSFDSTIAAHNRRKQHPDAVIHVFDAIPMTEWESGEPGAPLHERKRRLREAFAAGPIEGLRLCPSWECAMPQYAEARANIIMAAGGEGVVIKDRRSRYCRERNHDWLKLKHRKTYSVEITAWEVVKPWHKDGRPRIAALEGNWAGHRVRITNIGDRERKMLWPLGNDLVGRVCEVTALSRTPTGGLYAPRFVRLCEMGEGCGDPAFLFQLRKMRRPSPKTKDRVLSFMRRMREAQKNSPSGLL